MAVASIVMEYGAHENEVIGALLHDAAEDAGGKDTLDNIKNKFGEEVAKIVEECSDTLETPKPPYKERKAKYIAELIEKSPSSQLVSLADKLHNARSILKDYREKGEDLWKRFNSSKDDIIWYYDGLLEQFCKIPFPEPQKHLVQELKDTIEELKLLVRSNNNEVS
jgi:(p)ppGpp synthase/HD superfamily hydrolase